MERYVKYVLVWVFLFLFFWEVFLFCFGGGVVLHFRLSFDRNFLSDMKYHKTR